MRILGIAFGLVCYVAFLATCGYAIGFVGNNWSWFGLEGAWLRSLDARVTAPLGEAIAVDLSLIAFFGVQHSVMARRGFKEWSARVIPRAIERSTYVLASSVCLALLYWQWRPIGIVVWDASESVVGWVLVGVSLVGWLVAASSTFLIDHGDLFGLRQVFGASKRRAELVTEFKTPGLYKAVRHPLYFGFLVAFWAAPVMTLAHLVFALGLTVYVLVAIPLEERDLLAQYGERYRDYRKRVRALLPIPRSE